MGDTFSWLVLLLGLLAVVVFGVAILVALVAGIVLLRRHLFSTDVPSSTKVVDPGKSPSTPSSGSTTYLVVIDTIGGLNVRKRDNLFQALFIFVAVVLLAALGAVLTHLNAEWSMPWIGGAWIGGALIGGFGGLVIGFFASGLFLMVYRAVRHLQGRHQ